MSVLLIAALGVAFVLLAILVFRLHPLVALLLGSLLLLVATPKEILLDNLLAPQAHTITGVSQTDRVLALEQSVPDGIYHFWHEGDARASLATIESAQPIELTRLLDVEAAKLEMAQQVSISETENAWYLVEPASDEANQNPAPLIGDRLVNQDTYFAAQHSRYSRLGATLTQGFTKTFNKLGIPVTMAAIVGVCLLESGAAAKLVAIIIAVFGSRGTPAALTLSGFVLGVPVYFDNVFYLLLPLAKAVGRKRSTMFLSAVMAIIVGATMAHSLVPPTPGPLLVAAAMDVSVGMMMVGGLIVGSAAASAGFLYGMLCGKWVQFTPEQISASLSKSDTLEKPPERTPPLWIAALPIAFPIVVLAGSELLTYFYAPTDGSPLPAAMQHLSALNNPALVFVLTALLAIAILRAYSTKQIVASSVAKAISDAGTIVLLTCAGGAFGAALQQLQLAEAIGQTAEGLTTPWGMLLTAFFLTTIIRAAQGSATVAMITSASIVAPVMQAVDLPFHPIYVALAIGCGSKPLPWMNDSGFWQVATMTGMTPLQTLKSFSVALTLMGLTGFAVTLLGAWLLPLV